MILCGLPELEILVSHEGVELEHDGARQALDANELLNVGEVLEPSVDAATAIARIATVPNRRMVRSSRLRLIGRSNSHFTATLRHCQPTPAPT